MLKPGGLLEVANVGDSGFRIIRGNEMAFASEVSRIRQLHSSPLAKNSREDIQQFQQLSYEGTAGVKPAATAAYAFACENSREKIQPAPYTSISKLTSACGATLGCNSPPIVSPVMPILRP